MAPKPRSSKRLTSKCDAVKMLITKLGSGELSGIELPSKIHNSEPLFQQYGLTAFRTCYNNICKEKGIGKFSFFENSSAFFNFKFRFSNILQTFLDEI